MRKTLLSTVMLFGLTGPTQAELIDRGGGLIYDDVLDITWMQEADAAAGLLDWADAVTWAENLTFGGFEDWRLPSIDVNLDGNVVFCSSASEADCRDNELGYMYYQNLGGTLADNLTGNQGLIENIQPIYWSSTEVAPELVWFFSFDLGGQGTSVKDRLFGFHAWAVRDGDVGPDVLFDGGAPGGQSGLRVSDIGFAASAADFILSGTSTTIANVEFWTIEAEQFEHSVLNYFFFQDGGGFPIGTPILAGVGVNISKVPDPSGADCLALFPNTCVMYSFDLETPAVLEAETVYWIAINLGVDNPSISNTQAFWAQTKSVFMAEAALTLDSSFTVPWQIRFGFDLAFRLNGTSDQNIEIDMKPFGRPNKPNKVNPRSKGKTWVAILSDASFDTPFDPSSQVDIPTVEFGPDGAKANRYKVKDINKDGLGDLLLRFKIRKTGIACGDTEATLTGETFDGISFTGIDSIKTVGCKPKKCKKKHHHNHDSEDDEKHQGN